MSDPRSLPTPLGAAALTLFAFTITLFGTVLASGAEGATALAVGLSLGYGGLGTLAARNVPAPADLRLGLRGFAPRFLLPILLMAPAIILASEIDNWMPALLPPYPVPKDAALPTDPEALQLATLEMLITMVLLRPVLEEFFFRGVVQQGLVAHLGTVGGVLQTAVLSGTATGALFLMLAPEVALSAAAQAAFMGLLYGVLRHVSGSLLAPIVAAIGWGVLGIALAQVVDIPGFDATEFEHTPAWIVLACALPVTVGVWLAITWRIEAAPTPPDAPRVS